MSSAQFVLTRASVDDIPQITHHEYRCFHQIVREFFVGCKSEADIYRMLADPREVWVKAVDRTTGKIVAASNWKFFVNDGAPLLSDEYPPEWLEGKTREEAAELMHSMNEIRRRANPGPHVFAYTGFTDPKYRRQGIASMIMQWGCDLADHLSLPAWIEPTIEGAVLYRKFGFYEVEAMGGGLPDNRMRRDVRILDIEDHSSASTKRSKL